MDLKQPIASGEKLCFVVKFLKGETTLKKIYI